MIARRSVALAGLAAAALLLGSAQQAAALDTVKMTIAAFSTNYAPFFNAIEEGYFKEEGIEAEIVKAGGGVATPALLSGQFDFSTSESSAFSAIMKGGPLKVIVIEANRAPFQLWSTAARPQDRPGPQGQAGRHPDPRRHIRNLDAARAERARHERR